MALYVNRNNATYVDSFGVEHVPKSIRKFTENKNIITNIYKQQEYVSVMCGGFCIAIVNFMLKAKSLLHYLNLFSPNKSENFFSIPKKVKMKKLSSIIFGEHRKFRNHTISKNFSSTYYLQ